jgi:hypothetical protein
MRTSRRAAGGTKRARWKEDPPSFESITDEPAWILGGTAAPAHQRHWMGTFGRRLILTRFRGHPRRREDAPGVFDGEATWKTTAARVHAGVQGGGRAALQGRRAHDWAGRKDLDLTETSLREWVHRADIDAGKGPPEALTSIEREELTKLRREVKRRQMERWRRSRS